MAESGVDHVDGDVVRARDRLGAGTVYVSRPAGVRRDAQGQRGVCAGESAASWAKRIIRPRTLFAGRLLRPAGGAGRARHASPALEAPSGSANLVRLRKSSYEGPDPG